jgi:hypothetical protein
VLLSAYEYIFRAGIDSEIELARRRGGSAHDSDWKRELSSERMLGYGVGKVNILLTAHSAGFDGLEVEPECGKGLLVFP